MSLTSIIILNWNGIDFTKECIASLYNLTKEKFEVIVVDNGSKSGEITELRALKKKGLIKKLIENKSNIGFSAANNQGLRKAKGDYLLLLNNDTIVTKGWLSEMIKATKADPSIGIVGPHLPESEGSETIYGGGFVDVSGVARHSFNKNASEAEQVGGAAIFFKREVFERIGELDEGFSPIYFEETDYCSRARKAGFKVWFTPKSKVIHFGSKITKKQPTRWLYVVMNKNRLRYMLLHFPLYKLLLATPFELARALKSIFTLKIHWLAEAHLITLRSLGEILEKRARYGKKNLKVVN